MYALENRDDDGMATSADATAMTSATAAASLAFLSISINSGGARTRSGTRTPSLSAERVGGRFGFDCGAYERENGVRCKGPKPLKYGQAQNRPVGSKNPGIHDMVWDS